MRRTGSQRRKDAEWARQTKNFFMAPLRETLNSFKRSHPGAVWLRGEALPRGLTDFCRRLGQVWPSRNGHLQRHPPGGYALNPKANPRSVLESAKASRNEPKTNLNEPKPDQ